jgi:ketosteroid isomerase-like protein
VTLGGDLAVETGAFSMTTTMKNGKPITEQGKYLTVWKRQTDGAWKIIRDINNADPVTTPAK